jgi:predicted MFS family arabinose efflux permease
MSNAPHNRLTSLPVRTDKLPLPGLLALFSAAFTAVMTELLPAGVLPQISAGLQVPEGKAGLLVTGYATASFLAAIPLTAALRTLPRRPVLITGLMGFVLANTVTAISSSYALTLVSRLLAGAMGGVLWAMLAGYAARMVPPERRGRAIAIVLAGITVALSLGIPVGTAFADRFGWRTGFAALAVLAAAVAGWVACTVPGFPGEPAAGRLPLGRVVSLRGLPTVLLITLLLLTGHQAMYTYMAPFTEQSGFGRTSLVLFVFGAATVAGIWITGIFIDRHLRASLLWCLTVIVVAMSALGLCGDSTAILLTGVALWGVAFGGAPTLLQTALIDVAGARNADVATSMQATVYNIGIAAGSLTGGIVLESAGSGALPWATLPFAIAALMSVAVARRHAFPRLPPIRGERGERGEPALRR